MSLFLNLTCFCVFNMIYYCRGKPKSQAAHPLFIGGAPLQTKERRAMPMYVTYSDLIQIGIFIVTLIGLCYTIFGRKK